MTRRSTAARLLYLLIATVQLMVAPVAAWADAVVERESSVRGVAGLHIESQSDDGCPRIHTADCALCHAAFSAFGRPDASTVIAAMRRSAAPGPDMVRAHAPSDGIAWDAPPRAPPAST